MCDSLDYPMNVKLIRVPYPRLVMNPAAKWIKKFVSTLFHNNTFADRKQKQQPV